MANARSRRRRRLIRRLGRLLNPTHALGAILDAVIAVLIASLIVAFDPFGGSSSTTHRHESNNVELGTKRKVGGSNNVVISPERGGNVEIGPARKGPNWHDNVIIRPKGHGNVEITPPGEKPVGGEDNVIIR
jgi:hypothetical protein